MTVPRPGPDLALTRYFRMNRPKGVSSLRVAASFLNFEVHCRVFTVSQALPLSTFRVLTCFMPATVPWGKCEDCPHLFSSSQLTRQREVKVLGQRHTAHRGGNFPGGRCEHADFCTPGAELSSVLVLALWVPS